MIAGRRSDNAFLFLFVRELDERVAGAAFFKAPGALEIVEFAINLHPGQLAQRDGSRAWRFVNRASNALGRGLDIAEGGQRKLMDDG